MSIDLYRSFGAAARHLSFARAARELRVSPSAVAKNIARLEAQLGVRLFHRTTRQVRLTQDGESLHRRCQRVLDEIADLEAAAAGVRASPSGTLRLDVPITYGRRVLLPVLAGLRRRYPQLGLEVRFSDDYADLIGDGINAAVRVGALDDSRLVARRFDHQQLVTLASPAYLEQRGTPLIPADLARHECLVFRIPSSGRDWVWRFREGARSIAFEPQSGVRLGDGEALVAAATAGLGVVHVPSNMANEEMARGSLVEVLSAYRPAAMPISLVYPSQREPPLRLRALIEALTTRGA